MHGKERMQGVSFDNAGTPNESLLRSRSCVRKVESLHQPCAKGLAYIDTKIELGSLTLALRCGFFD